jgi:excisionase family DNA binding protein
MSERNNIDLDAIPREAIPAAIAYLAARLLSGSPQQQAPTEPHDADPLLTAAQAASRLHLAPSYVYELVRSQQLPAVRTGKYIRVKLSAVERFITQHENGATLAKPLDTMHTRHHDQYRNKTTPQGIGVEPGRIGPSAAGRSAHRVALGARSDSGPLRHGRASKALGASDQKGVTDDGDKKET